MLAASKEASMALSDDKLWDLWNAQGTDNMSKEEAFVFARAIEAEARRDALEEAEKISGYPNNRKTITAGRARLEGKP